jgi:alpha-amylase
MASICFYFQVHQPFRIKKYTVFDVGNDHDYFGESALDTLDNKKILEKVSNKCYLPANAAFLKLLEQHPEFKISYSISGSLLDQLEKYKPEVIDSFKALVATGRVELLNETYNHSLSFLYSPEEFRRQIKLHKEKVMQLFSFEPKVFRNTELIYNNDLAIELESLGFKGVLLEGADHIIGWRNPNFLHKAKGSKNLKLLLRNYKLSDDIAFRFSTHSWNEHPLTAPKFSKWVNDINGNGHIVNLFMDYETFGEHQWDSTGIFEFLSHLPAELLKHPDNDFVTPSEAIERFEYAGELDVKDFVSWADIERDLSAWLSNPMQHDAISKIYSMEKDVISSGDERIIDDWRKMQTSDHFYYMCTKFWADGDVHKYFSPYDSPYEAFINYMNALRDLKMRVLKLKRQNKNRALKAKKSVSLRTKPKNSPKKKTKSKK